MQLWGRVNNGLDYIFDVNQDSGNIEASLAAHLAAHDVLGAVGASITLGASTIHGSVSYGSVSYGSVSYGSVNQRLTSRLRCRQRDSATARPHVMRVQARGA
jgi:hypothetical protein